MKKLRIAVSTSVFILSQFTMNHAMALSVSTQSGAVVGVGTDNGVQMFAGIPYAEPPVGALRWKPPQPITPWTEPLVADTFGPACSQKRGDQIVEGTSEDCLTLNVWTPDVTPAEKLPVMVWFHPGSFSINSGSTWTGENLAKLGDVVVVSMNYRLNVFGFLALEELKAEDSEYSTTGNYGLEDQLLVLNWVQQNIGNFGGDPNNVTIFGESSGGMSVAIQLVSPKSQGLFHKAITQSGPSKAVDKSMEQAVEESNERLSGLGCQEAEDFLACLRGKSTEEVQSILPAEGGLSGMSWTPVNDNVFLADSPADLFAQGQVPKDIPVLYLVTKDEQMLLINGQGKMDMSEEEYKNTVTDLIKSDVDKVLAQYDTVKYPAPAYALGDILTDRDVKCPIRHELRNLSKAGVNVYMSYFLAGREDIPSVKDIGAFHTVDVDFVFFTSEGSFALNEREKVLSRSIISHWTSFAHTGNPNATAAGVAWPKYDMASNERYIEFDVKKIKATQTLFPQCNFWDSLGKELPGLGEGTATNTEGNLISTDAEFAGGVLVNGESKAEVSLADVVNVRGEINVDSNHIGLIAEVVVFASHGTDWYMLDASGNPVLWASDSDEMPSVEGLVAFKTGITLGQLQSVEGMYNGHFIYTGLLKIFYGYRITDGEEVGTIVTNKMPMTVSITEGNIE